MKQRYQQNELKVKNVYSQNNLPDTAKDGLYLVNLGKYKSIRIYWIALYVNDNNNTYFGNFAVEHILKEIKKFTGNRNIRTNIYRIQASNSIMCW